MQYSDRNPRPNAYFAHKDGTVAVTLALSIIPLLILLGFSIDFNRLRSAESATQASMDAAVLAIALQASQDPSLNPSELSSYGNAVFEAEILALNADVNCDSPKI